MSLSAHSKTVTPPLSAWLEQLALNMPEPACLFRLEADAARLCRLNERFEQWIDLPASALLGMDGALVSPLLTREFLAVSRTCCLALKTGKGDLWSEMSVTALESDGTGYALLTFRAVQTTAEMESRLLKTTKLLSSIIENIPSMIFVKNADNLRFEMFNRMGETLTGYSSAEMIGKSDYDFFPKDLADFFTQKDREVLNSRQLLDIPEEAIELKDGSRRILHTRKVPIFDEHNQPAYLLGISEDITYQKQAERVLQKYYEELEAEVSRRMSEVVAANQALRVEQAGRHQAEASLEIAQTYLSSVINKLPMVLFALDTNGQITLSEGKGLSLLGLRPGESVGRNVFEFYQDIPGVRETIARALQGEAFSGVGDVGAVIFETHWTPLYTESGELNGTIGISFDVTAHKRTEQALLEIQNQLEQRVQSATSELVLANQQLKELDAMRRNFVSTLTHDLRTPLIAQGRVLQLLKEEPLIQNDQKFSSLLHGFLKNNADLLQMVNNLLETYELEDGRIKVIPELVDLETAVDECCQELEQFAKSKDIALLNRVPGDLPPLYVDKLLLKRLMNNILGNALHNIPNGSEVGIEAEQLEDSLQITFYDNGQGIDPALMPELFTRYPSAPRSRKKIGSGLGLYICKMIMELHHGSIHVDSAPGQGTRVYVRFPLGTVPARSMSSEGR